MSLKESTYRSGSSTARTVVSGYGVEKARVEIVFDTKSGYFEMSRYTQQMTAPLRPSIYKTLSIFSVHYYFFFHLIS